MLYERTLGKLYALIH